MTIAVIILAAGQGTRMRSAKPKVLHKLAGRSLLTHVLYTVNHLNTYIEHNIKNKISVSSNNNNFNNALSLLSVVHGHQGKMVKEKIEHELDNKNKHEPNFDLDIINWISQEQQLGTGHAVITAINNIKSELDKNKVDQVLVLYGDVPLVDLEDLKTLISTTNKESLGIITLKASNPYGLGRIIRDENNNIVNIVEEKDANSAQKLITEVNTGIFLLPYPKVNTLLDKLDNNNKQQEYYLTDIVKQCCDNNININSVTVTDRIRYLGINNLYQLSQAERHYQLLTALDLLEQGVNIIDPKRIDIRGKLLAETEVTIDINSVFEGAVTIGKHCIIEPNCILKNVELHENVHVKANSIIENSVVHSNSVVGPFARIRPDCVIADNVHIGNFVEIKKSQVKHGAKINHLSYIGDSIVGKNVNVGAGTITCNYDGVNKHQTIIEDNAFIGSNSSLIAPVVIGANSTIGAGSTISKDTPSNKLTIARGHQKTIDNWQRSDKQKVSDNNSSNSSSSSEK